MSAQKRPRDPASGNMVSSSPMQNALAMPASQFPTLAEPARALHTTPPLWVGVSSLQTDGPHSVWGYRVAALQHKSPKKGNEQPAGGGYTSPADCRQSRHRSDPAHLTNQACSL
eukprot:scaffold3221_cov118-Isochrysis_galbana.AAC.12